jgi:hypothetical protein
VTELAVALARGRSEEAIAHHCTVPITTATLVVITIAVAPWSGDPTDQGEGSDASCKRVRKSFDELL